MSQVNTELGLSSTAVISLNDSAVRTLAGVASGQISMGDLLGKSYFTGAVVTTTSATGGGYRGEIVTSTEVIADTVPSGISGATYLWEKISGDSGATCNNPSSAYTTFDVTQPGPGTNISVWRCKVSVGATYYYTANVNVNVYFS